MQKAHFGPDGAGPQQVPLHGILNPTDDLTQDVKSCRFEFAAAVRPLVGEVLLGQCA
jgi:hypothetical protein